MNRMLCVLTGWLVAGACVAQAAAPSVPELIAQLKSADEHARLQAIDLLGSQGAKAKEAVAPLVELLKDAAPQVRAHAVQALGRIGAPARPVVPQLAALLQDPEPSVRQQVVGAIRRIRPGPQVMVPLCTKLLEDSDPGVRVRILGAIAEAGPEAVPGLIEALKNDKAAYWACLILREIGPRAKEAVGPLTERLKDPRPEVRREAALALGAMKKAAVPAADALAGLLADEHVRVAATFALGEIGVLPGDSEQTVVTNAESHDNMLSSVSLWTLARVKPKDNELRRKVTERLVEQLKSSDPFVRTAAARALAALPPAPEITIPIFEKGLQSADATTVHHALDALASVGEKAVPRLVDALKFEKARPQVIAILGQIGPPAAPASDALAKLTEDKSPRVVLESAVALGKIGPGAKGAAGQLAKLLDSPEEPAAHAAAFALGQIGPEAAPAADAALKAALKSRDRSLAVIVAWALGKIHPGDAEIAAKTVPVLVSAGLGSRLSSTRLGAAEALGELGPLAKPAAEALEKLRDDKDKGVREAVAKALKSIQG